MQHEVRSKISLMPEDAPGGNTDSGPDIRIYLLIYKFVNYFEKRSCTYLESYVIIFLVERAVPTKRTVNQQHSMSEWRNWQTR